MQYARMIASFHHGLFLLCAFAVLACSDTEHEPIAAGGSAASAGGGAGGNAGGAAGSTGGASGASGGAGGSGGNAGTNATGGAGGVMIGSGGDGGSSGMTADAGDGDASADVDGGDGETLPSPNLDCALRTDTVHCVSARGELDGVPIDYTCTMDMHDFRSQDAANQAWVIACGDASNLERRVQLMVPFAGSGPFAFDTADAQRSDVRVEIISATRNAASYRRNLDHMRIRGAVSMDTATGAAPILTGTFEARFSRGDELCGDASCPPAWVSASFRSVFDL